MLPLVTVPETIRTGLAAYRDLLCREAGCAHRSRDVTGLILRPNKTLPGIDETQAWEEGVKPSRRAMQAAVCEAGWEVEGLMPRHRKGVAVEHRGRGREGLSLDWTYAHHERGPHLWGVKKRWDHGEKRNVLSQTVMTVVVANREVIEGVAVVVQPPKVQDEEGAYLQATGKEI